MASKAPSRRLLAFLRVALKERPTQACRHQWHPIIKPLRTTREAATHTHAHEAASLSILPTAVDKHSAEYKQNASDMSTAITKMQDLYSKISLGGPQKARDKHLARGKMLPRDRITALLDPGSSFMEIGWLAGYNLYDGDEVPAAGVIAGIGSVEGINMITAARLSVSSQY